MADNKQLVNDAVAEELFNTMYQNKWKIYWLNFFRGIFFGFGSILGGTLVIAALAWILSLLVDLPGGVGNFIQFIVDRVQST